MTTTQLETGRHGAFRTMTLATVLLVLVTCVAFSPAIRGPEIFDDVQTIQGNPSIHQLWPLTVPLSPPRLTPVSGRPVVNYTLAIDYKLNDVIGIDQRDDPDGPDKTIVFHLTNLAIHIACGLLLLGLVHRTLHLARLGTAWNDKADGVAFLVAALWLLHPIQTEAVDYLTQRTELMVALCFFGTLYSSVRAWDAPDARARLRWFVAAVIVCLLGMGSKEVMVGAPFIVLLYDRVFRADSWKELIDGSRRWFYAALFGTLALLALLVAGAPRSATAGFHLGIPWYEYLHSQGWAISHYLSLVFWPRQLSLDYGPYALPHWRGAPGFLLLTVLFALTCYAWTRVQRWGWAALLGAWFFLILAPSSSILPVATEIAAERRIYLPLAAVMVLLVIACATVIERRRVPRRAVMAGAMGLLALCAVLTFQRSHIYQNHEAIWRDAVAKVPGNARAYNNLGVVVGNLPEPRLAEAESLYHQALALDPTYVNAMSNLAITEVNLNNLPEAGRWFQSVLAVEPENGAALNGLGNVLLWRGDTAKALPLLERLGQQQSTPQFAMNLGRIYRAVGRPADEVRVLELAVDRWPDRTDLQMYLGSMLLDDGRPAEAAKYLYQAVEKNPASGIDRALLSLADAGMGRMEDAVRTANEAVQEDSGDERVYYFAGRAMLDANRADLAEPLLTQAVSMDPRDTDAATELDKAEAALGKKPRRSPRQ